MAQRKQLIKNIYSDSQRTDETIQEEESAVDGDNEYENSSLLLSVSSSREKRRKEQEDKSKPKEMTEEEMMDLALRLSEKEASVTALQQQQEEEEVMKAIQESMVLQTQPCLSSSSKTLLSDTSLRLGSRRKLSYSNGERLNIVDEGLLEDSGTPEVDMSSEAEGTGGGNITSNKKRKRRAGSPLLKMPDLSQSQKVSSHSSQNSPCSSESFSAPLNSSQSSDSTHIGDSQLQKSPVFPLTGRRAVVHVDRLGQDLVETCRSSGFVLCSQDSLTFSQKSVQPRSPTFPQTNPPLCSRSPVFSETNRREDRQTEPSPDFSRNSLQEMSPTACRLQGCETSALVFSSQESLTPPGISCSPKSPVFPQSPHTPKILPPSQGLSISESSDRRKSAQNNDRSMSPVFGIAEPQRRTHTNVQESESPPAVQLQGPNSEEEVERREDPKSAGCSNGQFNSRPPKSEQPNKNSKHWNSAGMEQMSGMMLVWTDEDEDDDMPVDSPSPVFPEDRPVHQSDSQAASLNHDTTEKKPEPDCSPKTLECVKHTSPRTSSSASTSKQQLSTTEEEPHPISRREAACRMPPQAREPSSGPTVHYYWGVPFCPQGLDPDRYTQVILAQMEVYEKSLKQAQRCLLRKVEWGEAIHPQPEKSPSPEPTAQSPRLQVPRRRGLRLRGRKTSEAARSPPAEEEEEEEEEEQQQQEEEGDEKNKGDEEQMETDDCDVCPETQLSDNDSTHLTMVTDDGSQKSPELPEAEMILQSDSPARDEQQEEEEEEAMDETKMEESASCCRDGAGGHAVGEETEVKKDRSDPDVEEIKNTDPQRSASPELEAAVVPHSPKTSVDCPICQGSFPVSEIELHAAYCDGEVAVVSERRSEGDRYQESVKLRRKRARRAERAAEETNSLSNVCRKQEKCFICQKDVPLRDYSRHTELCCLRHTSRTTKGNLLSALEQTENRTSDAGPSGSKLQPEAVIDLRDDDDEDEDEAAGFRVSNSPIRSFTSISEAAGCLIDFKKQQRTKKPYQRRR